MVDLNEYTYTYKFKLKYTVIECDRNQEQYEKYVTKEQAINRKAELINEPRIRNLCIEEIWKK